MELCNNTYKFFLSRKKMSKKEYFYDKKIES